MEIRVLQYFLAVVKEESISAAAKFLHLSQPTLSRQLKDMENELGKKLFIRSNRKIILTEEGLILRKRAEEIIELMKKAQEEIKLSDEILSGDIYIGAGETEGVRAIIKVIQQLRKEYPLVHLHIVSGDKTTVLDNLEHGLIDFALVFGEFDSSRYDSLLLKSIDYFGVMMKKNDPLTVHKIIKPEHLFNKPLIVPRQLYKDNNISELFGCNEKQINIVGTYNLLFNGSLMVDEGMGYAICFDRIINITDDSNLCFRPLSVKISPKMSIVWKKHQVFTKLSDKFLSEMQNLKIDTQNNSISYYPNNIK